MLIHENVEQALANLVACERHVLSEGSPERSALGHARPGLGHVTPAGCVIALGRAAHTALADFQKRTLLAADLDLDSDDDTPVEMLREDITRFIWSCVNTLRVVAVGEGAWRSAQMLPLADRRFYEVPPLRIAPPLDPRSRQGVLVINHDRDPSQAMALAARLGQSGFQVEFAGIDGQDDHAAARLFCTGEAAVHVHVGQHSVADAEVRLVDTWYSRRLAFQLLPARPYPKVEGKTLLIDDEVDGFVCGDIEAVLASLSEVRQDRVLEKKIIDGGFKRVEPLAQAWTAIARDLLA